MQRRTWLKLGLGSAAVMAVAAAGLVLTQKGLDQAGRLGPAGKQIFSALGAALLEGSLPQDASARQIALNGLLERVDQLILALPPHAQDELSQLLMILSSPVGRLGLAGLSTDWPEATVLQLQEALHNMRFSKLALKRQVYAALHDMTGAAYFSDASTWMQLGYPGPLKI